MSVIPFFGGDEPQQCCAMPMLWPQPAKAPEGKGARSECEVWRGSFHRNPGCACAKLS
jgi:hypothetical protein